MNETTDPQQDRIRRVMALPLPGDAFDSDAAEAVAAMRASGLLALPVLDADQRDGLLSIARVDELRLLLEAFGARSLVLGRLYEGHVNALALVDRYASPEVRSRLFADAEAGHLFGVWNTDAMPGVTLRGEPEAWTLDGGKRLASGAGLVTRAMITAATPARQAQMFVVPLDGSERTDLSGWRAQGMRASGTGAVDFDGIAVSGHDRVGEADDYLRQPFFSCGAWRFLAVQTGGIAALLGHHRDHLRRTGRGQDPYQLARLGEAAAALETARLFVARAARLAAAAAEAPEAAIAYVNMARGAVESAALEVIGLAQRSVGLAAFMDVNPIDRLVRDLSTYLRQPAPDLALKAAALYVLDAPAQPLDLWGGP